MRYFFSGKKQELVEESKKSFCTRTFRKRRCFRIFDNKLNEESSYCEMIWSMEACEDYKVIEKFYKICSYLESIS